MRLGFWLCLFVACDDGEPLHHFDAGVDAHPSAAEVADVGLLDARLDADAPWIDAAVDATTLDADTPDAAPITCDVCEPSSDCVVASCVDGACLETPREVESICLAGECVERACGDGFREPQRGL